MRKKALDITRRIEEVTLQVFPTTLNKIKLSPDSFSTMYFHFVYLKLQPLTFTKILWVIASEAASEMAVTVIRISPRCVGLTGKRIVTPSSLGTRMVCWCSVALTSFEAIRISNLSLSSMITLTWKKNYY